MNAPSPLKKACDSAGYDYNKLPKGATDVKKNDDGTFTITVNGQPTKYNKDGSVFAQPAGNQPTTPATDNRTGNQPADKDNSDASIFPQNRGQGSGNGDLTITNINAGYDINPEIFMGAATQFDASTQLTSNLPFGLGAVFGQGNIAQSLQNFMKSVSFNFDFSYLKTKAEQEAEAAQGTEGSTSGQGTTETQTTPPAGDPEVTAGNNEKAKIEELAKKGGYAKTTVDGVYKKGDKYYKYDADSKKSVECNADGSNITEAQKQQRAKAAKKAKAESEAAKISEDLFDAMKGAGTKNTKLADTIGKITKDNVIEVFDAWKTNFADSMDNEDLIESIQNEHYTGWFGNQQEKEESAIVDALYERAMSLGLKNEAAACRAKVNSEHNSWFSSDSKVKTAIMTLVDQIKAKEAGVAYTKPQATT